MVTLPVLITCALLRMPLMKYTWFDRATDAPDRRVDEGVPPGVPNFGLKGCDGSTARVDVMPGKRFYRMRMNTTRNVVRAIFAGNELEGARMHAKMLLVPIGNTHTGSANDIPDFLVSKQIAQRFLDVEPPIFMVMPEYDQIIREIEKTYVLGLDFCALASACVAIERTLNLARIKLHKHHPKLKDHIRGIVTTFPRMH